MSENWRSLHAKLGRLTEQEVYDLLQAELAGDKRSSILERLHQRYCTLRAARERIEIMKGAHKV